MDTRELIEIFKTLGKKPENRFLISKRIEKENLNLDAPCPEHGWTLLQWALENDDDEAASFAIQLGASINARGHGRYDCTPLDIAARKNNERYIDLFTRHGGKSAAPVRSKRTKLISSAKNVLQELRDKLSSKVFVNGTHHFETHLGVPAKADKTTEFIRYRKVSLPDVLGLTGTRNEQLDNVVRSFAEFSAVSRSYGATLYADTWLGASLKKCDLILAPTDSDVDLLTALAAVDGSPLFGNVKFLDSLLGFHKAYPFRLLSINDDALVMTFDEQVANPDQLSKTLVQSFPFLRDYYTAGVSNPDEMDVRAILADEVRDDNAVQIVYHSF